MDIPCVITKSKTGASGDPLIIKGNRMRNPYRSSSFQVPLRSFGMRSMSILEPSSGGIGIRLKMARLAFMIKNGVRSAITNSKMVIYKAEDMATIANNLIYNPVTATHTILDTGPANATRAL